MTREEIIIEIKTIRQILKSHCRNGMEGIDHVEYIFTVQENYQYKVVLQKLTNDNIETFHFGQFVKPNEDHTDREWRYLEI